jgi:hypothetical protein
MTLRGIIGRAIQTETNNAREALEKIQRRQKILSNMRSAPVWNVPNPAYEGRERRVFMR